MAVYHFNIELKELRFHAGHGIYMGEAEAGSEFEVDATLEFETVTHVTELEQTVSYADVYAIIRQRMAIPVGLLENVAQDIAAAVHELDKRVKKITISIRKLNPPIENFSGTVGITCAVIF